MTPSPPEEGGQREGVHDLIVDERSTIRLPALWFKLAIVASIVVSSTTTALWAASGARNARLEERLLAHEKQSAESLLRHEKESDERYADLYRLQLATATKLSDVSEKLAEVAGTLSAYRAWPGSEPVR